jgi:hypothetical protein
MQTLKRVCLCLTDVIAETAEDLTNNFAGSIVGAMDRSSKEKEEHL